MWARKPSDPPAPLPEPAPPSSSSTSSLSPPPPPPASISTAPPNAAPSPSTKRRRPDRSYDFTPRLHMPFTSRLLLANFFASSAGFFLGAGIGSRKAALRFRAENAHRFPKSQKGWYFYHRSK